MASGLDEGRSAWYLTWSLEARQGKVRQGPATTKKSTETGGRTERGKKNTEKKKEVDLEAAWNLQWNVSGSEDETRPDYCALTLAQPNSYRSTTKL